MFRSVQKLTRMLDLLSARVLPDSKEPAHLLTGRRGEDEAYFHLRSCGYTVIARNYRTARLKGEIDLIGWDGDVMCFVEVKTRTSRGVASAEAAVDIQKQRDLRLMARDYLRKWKRRHSSANGNADPKVRFDIVSVYLDTTVPEIMLFKNAFAWGGMKA